MAVYGRILMKYDALIDGLVHDCSNSCVLAIGLVQSYTKPLKSWAN